MITAWNKKGEIVHQSENDSDFHMWEADTSVHGVRLSSVFPEPGYVLDGPDYRRLTLEEQVEAGILVLQPNQKIENGVLAEKNIQEQITAGVISLDDYKTTGFQRISQEVRDYLETSKTSSGYLVNSDAQKICIVSMLLPKDSQWRTLLVSGGLVYSDDKIKEVMEFVVNVKAARDAACQAIHRATNSAAIDSVTLKKFLS